MADAAPSIFSNVVAGVAGLTADANSLINYARTAAQRHLFSFNEDIPVEQLAQRLCDLKQGYTQYGGLSIAPPLMLTTRMVDFPVAFQVFDRLVYRYSMPAGIPTSNSSYIFLIRQEITPVGKRRASVPTTAPPNRCSSKNTRKTSKWRTRSHLS